MTTSPKKVTALSVFKNRRFRQLWLAQLVSAIGASLVAISIAILVYRLTGSALAVGGVLMAKAAPALILGLFAGVAVDRYDRKRIMVVADVVRGLLVLTIPVLLTLGLPFVYVAVALIAAVGTFFLPAHSSVLPEIASDEELAAANSMLAISSYAAMAVGFASGGFIAAGAAIEWAFYANALTFFASAALIAGIAIPKHDAASAAATSSTSVLRNLRTGVTFLWGNDLLRSLIIVAGGVTLVGGLHNALQLPFAIEALGASEAVFGLLQAASLVTTVLGAFLMATFANRLREGQWLIIAIIGVGVAEIFFAISQTVPLAIVFVMLSGLLASPYAIAGRLIIQRQTTREIRGRVSSAFGVVQNTTFLIGFALVGLADVFDVRAVYMVSAIGILGVGVAAIFMRGLGQPAAEWRRAVALLRGAAAAPGLTGTRAATPADFEALALHVPAFGRLAGAEIRALAAETLVADAPSGTVVVRRGEASDAGYFLISGRVIAGWDEEGGYRPLETLNAGDFFGEIAALTGAARTANVVADEDTALLQVPAKVLRRMSTTPELNRLLLSKMTERMARMGLVDLPRTPGLSAESLRELRSDEPEGAPRASGAGGAPPAPAV
jgi:MFS family permease